MRGSFLREDIAALWAAHVTTKNQRFPQEEGVDRKEVEGRRSDDAQPTPRPACGDVEIQFGDLLNQDRSPSSQSLIRLGDSLQIGLIRILALVLKREWECHLSDRVDTYPEESVGIRYGMREVTMLKQGFNPNSEILFELFEAEGGLAKNGGYDRRSFGILIREMILADMYFVRNQGNELEAFVRRSMKTRALLRECTPTQEETFWAAKCQWQQLQEELGEHLLTLEGRRLENANIVSKWMSLFGSEYIALMEQANRIENLELRIGLLTTHPNLTSEELDQMVEKTEAKMRIDLEKLRFEAETFRYPRRIHSTEKIDPEEFSRYRQECKRVLRELWLLIHPDLLQHHPAYEKLTEGQKEQLGKLWHRVMRIRPEEIGFDPGVVGYNNRSLQILLDAQASAKAILAHSGLDTETSLIIEGETLAEQVAWLQRATDRLECEIENVQAELKTLLEQDDIWDKSALLACSPEQQEKARAEMLERAEEYRQQADALEINLSTLLQKGNQP